VDPRAERRAGLPETSLDALRQVREIGQMKDPSGSVVPEEGRDALLDLLMSREDQTSREVRSGVGVVPTDPIHARRRPHLPERYTDLSELGAGGMGEVRLVRDVALRRNVAMKILSSDLPRTPVVVRGFVHEARIIGQLDHPNIPPVYELGADDCGVGYFTMKVVQGKTLGQWLKMLERPPGSPERLREGVAVLIKVCDALAFAHSRGVIHRDLKSDNIMLGEFGEVYLMDWGLAKVLNGRPTVDLPIPEGWDVTDQPEGIVGTFAYMSPEQAMGGTMPVDERSDIFGLGAVLYEIVTGCCPYSAGRDGLVFVKVKACAFVPPHDAAPGVFVPKEIAQVVMKAMAARPEDRYQSALALKADLRRFLDGGLYLPPKVFAPGARIVTEGEPGDSAYIVTRGECDVYRTIDGQRRHVRRMGPRSIFGETAVLSDSPRTATVEAVTEVTVLELTRAVIDEGLGAGRWESLLIKSLVERFQELEKRLGQR
jgi:serine/threonine-protein kinase